jgi:hypothetical protein
MIEHAQSQAALIFVSLKLFQVTPFQLRIPFLVPFLVQNQMVVIVSGPPVEILHTTLACYQYLNPFGYQVQPGFPFVSNVSNVSFG